MFKTINGWTKNKILKVLKARRYNAAAVNEEGTCAYTTSNGNRCAVGMFIPKGHKGSSVAGNVTDLLEAHPDLKDRLPLSPKALSALQRVHDDLSPSNGGGNAKEAMIEWVQKNVE